MIRVINVELNSNGWEKHDVDNKKYHTYWECPIVIKLLNEGWNLIDWKMSRNDCIFIFEKPDN